MTTVARLAAFVAMLTAAAAGGHPLACRAEPPATLGAGPSTWLGACAAGRADGPGTLRAPRGTRLQFFFGTMRAGRPVKGVMTTATGDYVPAWRFDRELRPIDEPNGDRAANIATFDAAAAGARAASARLRDAGNVASAKVYAQKADDLAKQLD